MKTGTATNLMNILRSAMMPMGMPLAHFTEPEFCWDGC